MQLSHAGVKDVSYLPLLLVSAAAMAARFAITEPGTAWFWPAGIIAGYATAAISLMHLDRRTGWFTRSRGSDRRPSHVATAIGVLLLLGPFAEGASRVMAATYFRPLEQVTIHALTNFAFFAVSLPGLRRSRASAVGVSFVLLIGGVMLGEHEAVVPLAAVYAGLGAAWLAQMYWRSIRLASPAGGAMRFPAAPVLAVVLLLGGMTATAGRLAGVMGSVWSEWAPSSGGSRWSNPGALLGVGDGDWVVSGPNARSTGSIDSEYFLESDLPTIYDVMSESYGEPRSPAELQRAIFIEQEQMLARDGHKAPDSGASGRQFSLYRKGRPAAAPPPRVEEDALLYVSGAVPLHLAMTVYERFDGVAWHEPQASNEVCFLDAHDADVSWLWLRDNRAAFLRGGDQTHELRIARLSDERLPLPDHLQRFRLGRHIGPNARSWALETFTWAHEGILRARRCLPPGTFLEVVSQQIDRARLAAREDVFALAVSDDPQLLVVPEHLRPSATHLAGQFAHLPRGLRQIEAIIEHLRTHYAHDRERTVPPTCADPVHHFLTEAKGGPSYQFATAAALALRSLGYPTRVVAGLYASPANFVAGSGYTTVRSDDAHFWIQVRTSDRNWITLDPTPGYETEWYRPTVWAQLVAAARMLAQRLAEHPLLAIIAITVSVAAWLLRTRIVERFLTWRCLVWPYRRTEHQLLDALHVLDLRSRLSGAARPQSMTPLAWYGRIDDPVCHNFLKGLYAVLYGSRSTDATLADELAGACRVALRRLRARVLRKCREAR